MSYGSLCFCQRSTSRSRARPGAASRSWPPAATSAARQPVRVPRLAAARADRRRADPDNNAAAFSNTNGALDLVAPGVGIIAPTPPASTRDGTADGYEVVDGTSFAAPIVAAAAIWVRACARS